MNNENKRQDKTNNLTNNINLLNSAKKTFLALFCGKTNETSLSRGHSSVLNFLIFCKQKNIGFSDNKNTNESHLGMKKLHLNS